MQQSKEPRDGQLGKSVTAGLTGLVLGVAAGATAMALSDPKVRQRAGDKASKLGRNAKQGYQQASSKLQKALKDGQTKVKQGKEKTEELEQVIQDPPQDSRL